MSQPTPTARHDDTLCRYNGSTCPNKRVERGYGRAPLRVCEFHRRRANAHQKQYQQRKKQQRRDAKHNVNARSTSQPRLGDNATPVSSAVVSRTTISPQVVFVVAREHDVNASLRRLARRTQQALRVEQPFRVISEDRLDDMLRSIDAGEDISDLPSWDIGVDPRAVEAKALTDGWSTSKDYEPLAYSVDRPLLLDDMWSDELLSLVENSSQMMV